MADDKSVRIKRIDAIAAPARAAWFTLLGVLAFVAVTMLSITHADILLDSRMIGLPVVGVSVPTNLFLILTPVVILVLYTNLHLYLLKLWQAFRRAPTDAELGDDRSVADEIQPWLVNDYALALKNGTTPGDHHRSLPRNFIILFTVWWAPVGMLGWMWYTSLLTRDVRVIAVILGCAAIAGAVGLHSWLRARKWLSKADGTAVPLLSSAALAGAAIVASIASWTATEQEGSFLAGLPGLPHQFHLDRENLVDASVQGALAQRADFRKTWCGLANLPTDLCGNMPAATPFETNRLTMQRRSYCRQVLKIGGARQIERCDGHFLDLDRKFDAAWREIRREKLAQLPRLDLSNRDLAGASAEEINLTGARLEKIRLSGAHLPWGRLEGAQLKQADLSGATAFYTNLSHANLTWATLDGVNLESSNLEGAVLEGATLKGARLNNANLVAANLSGADLRGAELRGARLHRANLAGAILDDADLTNATGLTQAQLDQAIGSAGTKLTAPRRVLPRPKVIVPSSQPVLQPYRVSTCWKEPPKAVARLLERPGIPSDYEREIKAIVGLVCPPSKDTVFEDTEVPSAETAEEALLRTGGALD